MFLKSGKCDKEVDGPSQGLANDKVLRSSDLETCSKYGRQLVVVSALRTPSRRLSSSFRALVRRWSASEPDSCPMRKATLSRETREGLAVRVVDVRGSTVRQAWRGPERK